MLKNYTVFLAILMLILVSGCDKSESDCGAETHNFEFIRFDQLFKKPSEIYWGVSGTTRSYTYNFTFSNICTKKNPKVTFEVILSNQNGTLSNPFSFRVGTSTCLAAQAQLVNMTPVNAFKYKSSESEIGMQQCFSGQSSATLYPFITISFTTLGSSRADSIYLTSNIDNLYSGIDYNLPK